MNFKYKILIFAVIFFSPKTTFAQLGGGTICESDDLQCLNNAPSISIDGISIAELIPFALPSLLIIFVIIIFVIIWKTYNKH